MAGSKTKQDLGLEGYEMDVADFVRIVLMPLKAFVANQVGFR